MSKPSSSLFPGTKGSNILSIDTSKQTAISSIDSYPDSLKSNAKRFYKGASQKYDRFEAIKTDSGEYKLGMRKPGNVPGSYAIYYKIVDSNGKTIKAYKETYDPKGNLVHVKEKK